MMEVSIIFGVASYILGMYVGRHWKAFTEE